MQRDLERRAVAPAIEEFIETRFHRESDHTKLWLKQAFTAGVEWGRQNPSQADLVQLKGLIASITELENDAGTVSKDEKTHIGMRVMAQGIQQVCAVARVLAAKIAGKGKLVDEQTTG
jgi:hypothetical protein